MRNTDKCFADISVSCLVQEITYLHEQLRHAGDQFRLHSEFKPEFYNENLSKKKEKE